jgi:Tol biopolymer transport system component
MDPLPAASSHPTGRLDSWKEIARYLNRDESTVQRWEKREGMPVHRHVHDKRGSVYAYRAELDVWWQGRRQQLETKTANGTDAPLAAGTVPPAGAALQSLTRRRLWISIAAALVLVSASLIALTWLPRYWSPAGPTTAIVRLTSTSGLNIDPAFSLDGSLLAYASDRGGSGDLDIWVQPISEERPTRITSEPGDELEPAFSPDGKSIVFSKGEAGGIYVVAAAGGKPRRLVAPARARTPRFSPDGQWVTYWTGLPVWVIPNASRATGALFVVPASGGSPRPLAPEFAHARYGAWSPDGARILFVGARERDSDQSSLDWYVVDANGGEPIRTGALGVLRSAGLRGVPVPGAWRADGDVIFANYDDGASNVWQLAVSPATARVAGMPVRLTFGTAIERSPAVTSSGRVAFTSVAENVDVWRLPLDATTGLASGAIARVTDNAAIDRVINVSDDGRTIAFVSSRTGKDEVWLRDVQTGREGQLRYPNARSARVSRDGSMLAVDRGTLENRGVDLVPAAGGTASALCDGCDAGDWSPDGTRLVVQRGSPSRLLLRTVGSGREIELAAHPTWNLFRPRLSPDGRWVVFHTTNTPSLRQIYAIPAFSDVSVPVDAWIPVVADFGVHPSWAPDGAAVYHFSLRDGAFCAWLQPIDPETKRPVGVPRAVEHFHEPRLRAVAGAGATNHVAAGYMYVTLTSSAANIWMLDR